MNLKLFFCSEKRFYFEYADAQMRLTIIFTFNEEELPKEQESISVEFHRLLADSLCFIVNKFEHVRGSVQRRGWGQGLVHGMRGGQDWSPVEWGTGARPCTGTLLWTDTQLKRLSSPHLHWRVVIKILKCHRNFHVHSFNNIFHIYCNR